ncbi:cytochrome P450 10-like [Glandiceps talaboti]
MYGLRQVRVLEECARTQYLNPNKVIQRLRSAEAATALDFHQNIAHNKQTKCYKPFDEVPGPAGLPFIGSLLDYTIGDYTLEKMHLAAVDRFRTYGPIFKEKIADNTFVNIINARDVEHLFRNAGRTPARPPIAPIKHYREIKKRNIGIASLQGEEWERVRKPVQQVVMKPQKMQSYIPVLDDIANDFVELMKANLDENGEIADYQNQVYKWALEGVATIALNTRLGCLANDLEPDSNAQKMIDSTVGYFDTLRDLMYSFPLYKFGIYNKTWKKFADCHDTFLRIAEKHINIAIEDLKQLTEEGKLEERAEDTPLLLYLLSKKTLSLDEILMVPVDLMQAGIDTTSHTIVFNLYLLATNPEVQDKLYEEINSSLPEDNSINAEILQKLPYLKACIKETHRMLPTIDGTTRILDKEIILSGYRIPPNTVVRTHCIAGLMEEYFEDYEEYKPERWLREDCQIDPHLLLSFGSGARMCIGRRFAEQEMRILLAKLIKNFRIEWHHGPMTQLFRLTNCPDVPARFTFIRRDQ